MNGLFGRFNDYDIRHFVSIEAEGGADETVHRVFAHQTPEGSNSWFEERERRSQLEGYLADLELSRSLTTNASTSVSATTVGLQLRYALIAGAIRDLASKLGPAFLAHMVQAGVWRREQALTWARVSPEPSSAIKVVVEELRRDSGQNREELARLALLIGESINDSDARVSAVASLAGDVPGFLLRQTLESIAKEQNEGSRLGGFRALVPNLPSSLAIDALKVARNFKDQSAKVEALALIAPHLEEPERSEAFNEFLLEARALLQSTTSHRISVERLAKILPPEQFQEFGKLIDSEVNPYLYEDFLKSNLLRCAEQDPDRAYEQAKLLSERSAGDVFMLLAKTFAERRQYFEAADAGQRVSKGTWEWDRNSDTLTEILKALPESEWSRWTPILDLLSDSPGIAARVRILCTLAKTVPDRAYLSRMIQWFCRDESEELQVRAAAAAILEETERAELLSRSLRESDSKLRDNLLTPLAPFLNLAQVRNALYAVDQSDGLNIAPDVSLLGRLAQLEPDEAVEMLLNLPGTSDLARANLAVAVAPVIPAGKLPVLRRAIRPTDIAWQRATACCVLLPWLQGERVDRIIAEVSGLEDVFQRIRVLNEMIAQFPADRLHHITRVMLQSLEWYVSRPSVYRDDLVSEGFRTVSRALARSPSDELSTDAIALATREELGGEEQITHLMDLVIAGGSESHQRNVLSTAFRLAIAGSALYPMLASGLSRKHAKVLGALVSGQEKDEEFVLLLLAASEFLSARRKETAAKRLEEISNWRLKFAGLDALLPQLPPPARVAIATRELEHLTGETVNPELLVPLLCLLVRHVPSSRDATFERCINAFMQLEDFLKVANGGLLIEVFKPGRDVVDSIWAALSRLPEEDRVFAYAGLGPWLDSAHIASALELLVKQDNYDAPAWMALLSRASQLKIEQLVVESVISFENGLFTSKLIEQLAPELPLSPLESICQYETSLDYTAAKAFRHLGYEALGALALRAAELGDLGLTLAYLELRKGSRQSGDTSLERVYKVAPKSWSERLIEYSKQLYLDEQPVALANLVMKLPRKRRIALVELILAKLSTEKSISTDRMRVMRKLEPELKQLPPSVIASLWTGSLDRSSKLGRDNTLDDVSCFAPILVHHFGPTVAQALDDAIRIGGTDRWP